jgi:hypothetical protein
MNAYTVEEIAEQWHCKTSVIDRVIAAGRLKTRRDGLVSERTLNAYIDEQRRLTNLYLKKRRAGMSAKQAQREVWGDLRDRR